MLDNKGWFQPMEVQEELAFLETHYTDKVRYDFGSLFDSDADALRTATVHDRKKALAEIKALSDQLNRPFYGRALGSLQLVPVTKENAEAAKAKLTALVFEQEASYRLSTAQRIASLRAALHRQDETEAAAKKAERDAQLRELRSRAEVSAETIDALLATVASAEGSESFLGSIRPKLEIALRAHQAAELARKQLDKLFGEARRARDKLATMDLTVPDGPAFPNIARATHDVSQAAALIDAGLQAIQKASKR
ncbi:MAG: hypothetical protein WC807_21230 [Hyphomicrobium sp.]|jgi:hypothetical protein